MHFACHHVESAEEYEKHSTSASWIWIVDLVTGQIATLVEEDRYGIASALMDLDPKLHRRELAASLHHVPCDE